MSRIVTLGFVALAALIVIVAFVTADDDELSPAESRLSSAIAHDLLAVEPGQAPSLFTSVESICVSDKIVAGVGMVKLNELGVDRQRVAATGFNPQTIRFDEGQRAVILGAFDGCVDLLSAAVQSVAPDAGQATVACLEAAFGDEGAKLLWSWRIGPADEGMPEDLPGRLAIADECLIG